MRKPRVSKVPSRYPMPPARRSTYRLTDAGLARLAPMLAGARKAGLTVVETQGASSVSYQAVYEGLGLRCSTCGERNVDAEINPGNCLGYHTVATLPHKVVITP